MIFAVYAMAIDKYIEVVWETAVRKHRISELRTLVDQALDERDEEAFYQYSTELNRLRKGG
ncbi:IDEAL domain-containing protein [Paenibacillus sp. FSL H7-0323]|uniref:IDEAL domain-containing protein n=1 Tax=Paenibacillus sp. FSL H7-0323 TaxID=2921433 RepID=UPI0030F5D704